MSAVQPPKASFLENLTNAIHLDYVLKFAGAAVFALVFFDAWHSLSFAHKLGFALAPVMWFVGDRFNKIYK